MRIQKELPDLNAGQREFLISGITQEEWTAAFGGKEYEQSTNRPHWQPASPQS